MICDVKFRVPKVRKNRIIPDQAKAITLITKPEDDQNHTIQVKKNLRYNHNPTGQINSHSPTRSFMVYIPA